MGSKILATLLVTLAASLSFAEQVTAPIGMMIGDMSKVPRKYPRPINVDYCREQEKKCAGQKMEEVSICLIGPKIIEDPLEKLSVYRWCGFEADKFLTQSQEDINGAFDSLLQKCVKIKSLRIFAHGAPGVAQVRSGSDLSLETTREQFANFSCLMGADANIDLMACNSGRGCRGEDFMANFAQTMLPKGGTFTANTSYAVYRTMLPPFNLNLTKKQVKYKPNSWPRFEWNYLGQVSGIKDRFKQDTKTCIDEIQTAIKEFKSASKDAKDQVCAFKYSSELKKAEALIEKLHRPQIEDSRNSKKYFRSEAPYFAEVVNSLESATYTLNRGACDTPDGLSQPERSNGVQ